MKLPPGKVGSIFRWVASPRLTVICAFLLVVVVIWGTVYQLDNGLYPAQQKFFHSWVIFLFGFIPFPGTVSIFWILFFNVLGSLLYRIRFRFSNIGNILTHTGILIFFVGSFFSFYFSQESELVLREGQKSNFSISDRNWEMAAWKNEKGKRLVYAVDSDRFRGDQRIPFDRLNLGIQIKAFHHNCTARTDSGLLVLEPKNEQKEPLDNIPGGIFMIGFSNGRQERILLYGADKEPTSIKEGGQEYFFALRKKRFPLPFFLRLIDFRRTFHPNSEIPRSYESTVEMEVDGFRRQVIISMNKPLRYRDFTLYQSSFFISPEGAEYTYLAVVENWGRALPYISSCLIFLGLGIHFLGSWFGKRKKAERKGQST